MATSMIPAEKKCKEWLSTCNSWTSSANHYNRRNIVEIIISVMKRILDDKNYSRSKQQRCREIHAQEPAIIFTAHKNHIKIKT